MIPLKNKKGQAPLIGLREAVMALLFVGVIAAAGAIALNEFQTDLINDIAVTTITNESVTLSNSSNTSLANNYVTAVSGVKGTNQSGTNRSLATTEFTVTNLNSIIHATIILDNDTFNGTVGHVNYTFRDELSTFQTNVTSEGLLGTRNATSFLSTIGTLLGVAALVAIVVGAFLFARR